MACHSLVKIVFDSCKFSLFNDISGENWLQFANE